MSRYRGVKGKAALGGVVTGSPLVQDAVAQGASGATFDGSGFNGVVRPGDVFTVAGDEQEYTVVSGGVVGATTPNELDLTFAPTVQPAEGWDDNAAVTFQSNSIAQVLAWEATPSRPIIETTTMGQEARRITLDVPGWRGRVRVQLDYGDAAQKDLVDAIKSNDAVPPVAVVLVAADDKQFWGDLEPVNARVGAQRGALVEADFEFEGEGALAINWS